MSPYFVFTAYKCHKNVYLLKADKNRTSTFRQFSIRMQNSLSRSFQISCFKRMCCCARIVCVGVGVGVRSKCVWVCVSVCVIVCLCMCVRTHNSLLIITLRTKLYGLLLSKTCSIYEDTILQIVECIQMINNLLGCINHFIKAHFHLGSRKQLMFKILIASLSCISWLTAKAKILIVASFVSPFQKCDIQNFSVYQSAVYNIDKDILKDILKKPNK